MGSEIVNRRGFGRTQSDPSILAVRVSILNNEFQRLKNKLNKKTRMYKIT